MFIGHYGPSFVGKVAKPAIPLWVLFLSVQLVDIAWSILVLFGIEKLRIVPGFTATNPLDLYYMPFTLAGRGSLVSGRSAGLPGYLAHAGLAGIRNRGSCRVLALDPRSGGAPP